MSPLTWQRLALIVAGSCVTLWLITRLASTNGMTPVPIPWTVLAVSVVGAALALISAWSVRKYVKGDKPDIDPLRAARIAVFAQAAAYAGAVLTGAYGGYALGLADEWAHAPRRDVAISALIAALGGVVLLGAGVIGERWCRNEPPDDDDDAEAEAA